MNALIISASHRAHSQSAKVGDYLKAATKQFTQVEHIQLIELQLPFWDGDENKGKSWPTLREKVTSADALILITPEWNGMASPLLKNFLMMCETEMTAHKPVIYVSVSSGISGAYPIAELKMDGAKNNSLIPLSEHLIIRNVEQALNPEVTSQHDEQIRHRINYSLEMLYRYAEALKTVRISLVLRPFAFINFSSSQNDEFKAQW